MDNLKTLTASLEKILLQTLKERFEKNNNRHKDIDWSLVQKRLEFNKEKLWTIHEMERTGGEPDIVGIDEKTGAYLFFDCAAESPSARRSLCYDREGLNSRKELKPANSAKDMAEEIGIEILNETQYRFLQTLGKFDSKTSSWLNTPSNIRKLGGAIFGDFRFNTVFVYHNGAGSYYGGRGFRGFVAI
jgi:hypothetical protein